MDYVVRFVRDDELPGCHDWAFACVDGTTVLLMKESHAADPAAWCDAWAAWRQMVAGELLVPPQRIPA